MVIAHGAVRVQNKRRAVDQFSFAVGELTHTYFRALQICHDGDFFTDFGGNFAHQLGTVCVVLGSAVAKIQAHYVNTRAQHGF